MRKSPAFAAARRSRSRTKEGATAAKKRSGKARDVTDREGRLSAILPLRPLFDLRVELAAIVNLGPTPLGERRIINITGGTFVGERLSGRILPGGADWQIIRADGAADLDARYTLETDSGRLIQVQSRGLRHGPPEILARLAAGEPIDPSQYYFRTVLRFETGAAELDWLNRVIAVARGARRPRAVHLNAFEVL